MELVKYELLKNFKKNKDDYSFYLDFLSNLRKSNEALFKRFIKKYEVKASKVLLNDLGSR
jgi:hypothetical protein